MIFLRTGVATMNDLRGRRGRVSWLSDRPTINTPPLCRRRRLRNTLYGVCARRLGPSVPARPAWRGKSEEIIETPAAAAAAAATDRGA